jgi:APA family basic amino acid/polyamine antiporter
VSTSPTEPDSFSRSLGLLQVTASGVAIIVGAGIFVLLGPAAERAGGQVWMSFLVAAALCALTAFSYMELASMYPRAGSEFEFARQVFPSGVAFAVGWSMAAALVVATATVAVGFARYATYFIDVDVQLLAPATVVVAVLVSARGMAVATRVIVLLAALQVIGLLAIVGIGAPSVGDVDLFAGKGVGGVLSAAALIFFAYIGFDEVITLSEETHNPRRTIPLALFLALAISTVLYVAVALVAVSVLGPDSLAMSDRPLADVTEGAVGGWAVDAITALSLVSTFTTVLLAATAGARMLYALASAGFLPPKLAEVRDGHTPRAALLSVAALALILTQVGDISLLASATDALVFLMFIVTNVVLVILRFRAPDLERPFRVAGAFGRIPVVPILGLVVTLILMGRLRLDALMLASGLIVMGLLAWQMLARILSKRVD